MIEILALLCFYFQNAFIALQKLMKYFSYHFKNGEAFQKLLAINQWSFSAGS